MSKKTKVITIVLIIASLIASIVIVPSLLFRGVENMDSGVSACVGMTKTNNPNASFAEDQYVVIRTQFETSRHEDVRLAGEHFLDSVYLAKAPGRFQVMIPVLKKHWADLQEACNGKGVSLPPLQLET